MFLPVNVMDFYEKVFGGCGRAQLLINPNFRHRTRKIHFLTNYSLKDMQKAVSIGKFYIKREARLGNNTNEVFELGKT
jgi:hypothetical protein